jgi:hypothetical protein
VSFREEVNRDLTALPAPTSTRSDGLAYLAVGCRAGIIVSLVLIPGFEDFAQRDSGLLVAAMALARLTPIFRRDSVRASKGSAS